MLGASCASCGCQRAALPFRRAEPAPGHLPRRTLLADRPPPRKAKAQVAVARSILVIIWHLLADPAARYTDLGPGYYQARTDKDRRIKNHIRQIEALLGHPITITKAA